jgi:hypothetical protein
MARTSNLPTEALDASWGQGARSQKLRWLIGTMTKSRLGQKGVWAPGRGGGVKRKRILSTTRLTHPNTKRPNRILVGSENTRAVQQQAQRARLPGLDNDSLKSLQKPVNPHLPAAPSLRPAQNISRRQSRPEKCRNRKSGNSVIAFLQKLWKWTRSGPDNFFRENFFTLF